MLRTWRKDMLHLEEGHAAPGGRTWRKDMLHLEEGHAKDMEEGHAAHGGRTCCTWRKDMLHLEEGHAAPGGRTCCTWRKEVRNQFNKWENSVKMHGDKMSRRTVVRGRNDRQPRGVTPFCLI